MTKPMLSAAVAAATLFTLAACQQPAPQNVGGAQPDAVAREAASRPPVELPPAIKETKTYRCRDTSVIQVNFLADDLTANVRPGDQPTAAATVLKAPAAGEAFVAEGYSLSGSGDTVNYATPTVPSQPCKA